MKAIRKQFRAILLPVVALLIFGQQSCFAAASPEFKDGVIAYNKGDYKTAVGSFMSALNTEFNNAILHYYLGQCFVHLKQPESAVREFRIAYALSPDNEVGKFAKEALGYLNTGTEGAASAPSLGGGAAANSNFPGGFVGPGSDPIPAGRQAAAQPKNDPALEQAISSLRKQTFFAKSYESKANDFLAKDAERQAQEQLARKKNDLMQDNMRYGGRRQGYYIPDKMPVDSQRLLDNLKSQFESQANVRKKSGEARVDELQRSADNLENLLHDKTPGAVKLKPAGTNLYIRNYESQKKQEEPVSPSTPSPF